MRNPSNARPWPDDRFRPAPDIQRSPKRTSPRAGIGAGASFTLKDNLMRGRSIGFHRGSRMRHEAQSMGLARKPRTNARSQRDRESRSTRGGKRNLCSSQRRSARILRSPTRSRSLIHGTATPSARLSSKGQLCEACGPASYAAQPPNCEEKCRQRDQHERGRFRNGIRANDRDRAILQSRCKIVAQLIREAR